ncbi:MAG TPA: glycosyltransferase family 2 protein [Candidatus Saccharimonadales bacterium]|nr:glycosyltransferase family 2 protein [Candidatus Saccharimonadales bacterium]
MNAGRPILGIVAPCYNESAILEQTWQRLTDLLQELVAAGRVKPESFLLFVDDGSSDATWAVICAAAKSSPFVSGLKLSRNCGHQNALLAGLMRARHRADCVISIDSDLQQDERAIFQFLEKYQEGCDIVFGVRNERKADSFLKRRTAQWFYKLMQLMGVKILPNHADYRLASRRVLDALAEHKEVNLFLRGVFPSLGFKSAIVYHDVGERAAGASKYTLARMLSFALKGVTSFSVTPIRIVSCMGALIFAFSFLMSCYVLLTVAFRRTVPGWASTVLPIYFIGGLQILSLGIVGEYVGKIYTEVKRRPLYIVEEEVGLSGRDGE